MLPDEIHKLEKERAELYEQLINGELAYEKLQQLTERVNEISKELDLKEMRWLELSEQS